MMRALLLFAFSLCLAAPAFAEMKVVGTFKVQRVHSQFQAADLIEAQVVWDTRASLANIIFKDRLGLIDVSLTDEQRKSLLACLDDYFTTDKFWNDRLIETSKALGELSSVITFMPFVDSGKCPDAADQFKNARIAASIMNEQPAYNLFVLNFDRAYVATKFGVQNPCQLKLDKAQAKKLKEMLALSRLKGAKKDYREPIFDDQNEFES